MEFDEDWWWNFDHEEIHFRGREGEKSVLFRITQIAITDHFKASDNGQKAEELFQDNRDLIEEIARIAHSDDAGSSEILIKGGSFAEYARMAGL